MFDNKNKNRGLILARPELRDWVFGGISGVTHEVLRPDGQWLLYLPDKEWQNQHGLETMACVSYAHNNVLETLFRQRGIPTNFSDRFTAKVSGTTRSGNSLSAVAYNAAHLGMVSEVIWPWPADVTTWDGYYIEPPDGAYAEALNFLKKWALNYEWVEATPAKMMEALKFSPLQVCNLYHSFEVIGYEEGVRWLTFDTYGDCNGSLPWDYKFEAAMLHFVTPIIPNVIPMYPFQEDVLYQLVEGVGGFFLYAAGKLRKDDTAKLLASWEVRNHGVTAGKVATLTLKYLDGVQLYDLKGNLASL